MIKFVETNTGMRRLSWFSRVVYTWMNWKPQIGERNAS